MTNAQIVKLQDKIERLERQIGIETDRLKELQFDAELLRCRLSEATVRWGTAAEKELLTHPKFTGLMARLVKAL